MDSGKYRNEDHISATTRTIAALVMLAVTLTGCGGTKLMKEPDSFQPTGALATGCDSEVCAELDWVIVRNGPGSWSKNAAWDEYLIRVTGKSSEIMVEEVFIVDSLGYSLAPGVNRHDLRRNSKKAIKRYRSQDLNVRAGDGTATMVAAGVAAPVVGASLGAAAMYSSAAAVAGVGLLIVAPAALLAGGIVKSSRANKVDDQIQEMKSIFPLQVSRDDTKYLNVFVPYAPSPQRVDVVYTNAGERKTLTIDTREALAGLHYASE